MKVRDFGVLETKLKLRTRNSGDRLAWFEYHGRVITRTKRSYGKGFDLPQDLILQELKLNEDQLTRLIDCSLFRDDYVSILKTKGLIDD
jgi:hypothetical protein